MTYRYIVFENLIMDEDIFGNYEKIKEEIEKYRPYFEEFADRCGESINKMLGYSKEVNICINFTWIMGYLVGHSNGIAETTKIFEKELVKYERLLEKLKEFENEE